MTILESPDTKLHFDKISNVKSVELTESSVKGNAI